MFQKVHKTSHLPLKSTIVYDGKCDFCIYWLVKWRKILGKKGEEIQYESYQEVAKDYSDINIKAFQQAAHLIDIDGRVYSGPAAAYYSLYKSDKYSFLHNAYKRKKWFYSFSDKLYDLVANNRNLFYKISRFLFGNNPQRGFPYWLIYIVLATIVFFW